MENCTNFLDQKLNFNGITKTYNSSWCTYPTQTQQWKDDPCCNPVFEWSEKYCKKRSITSQFDYSNGAIEDQTKGCYNPKK